MRTKQTAIKPGSDIASKILNILKKQQGDETLYEISRATGMQQGTLRRKLENSNGWAEIHFINELLVFLGTDYETVFGKGKIDEDDHLLNESISLEAKQIKLAETLLVFLKSITESKLKVEETLKQILPMPYKKAASMLTDPRMLEDVMHELEKKSPKSRK